MVARVLAAMLVGMSGAAVGANGVESLFFSRFGPQFLPYLYVGLGVVTFGVMMGMSGFLSRPDAIRRLAIVPLLLAIGLAAARAALLADLRWFYPVLWLAMMVIWTVQVMISWGLAGAVHDTRQAKRLFPLYGAALILGSVLGGLGTGPLASWIGPENLTLVWTGALVAIWLLARPVAGARKVPRPTGTARPGFLHEMSEGLRLVRETALLRWMALALTFFAVLYFTLALLFAEAATERFPRTAELAGFLGLFMGVANGAALLVSLLVANRLFARFGVPAMVMALALIYLMGFGLLLASSTFAAVVAFRLLQMLWVNGVWATGWQALFNVVPFERRTRVRSFMDGGPLQAGVILSGVLLILAERVLSSGHLFVAGLVAAALAAYAMWRARRAYAGALVEALRMGNPDVFRVEDEPFGGVPRDAEAHAALLGAVSDPDPAVRRIAVEILAEGAPHQAIEAMRRGLADDDPVVRAAALRGLTGADHGAAADEIQPLLHDPEAAVRRAAIDALVAGDAPQDLQGLLEPLFADPAPEVRARSAGALLPTSGEPARDVLMAMSRSGSAEWRAAAVSELAGSGAHETVIAGLADPDPVVRRASAAASASLDPDRSVSPLVEALGDSDPTVRDAAAEALCTLGAPAAPAVVEALARPELEAGALVAVARLPGADPDSLRAYASAQVSSAIRAHRLWQRVRSGEDERLDLLAHALRHRALTHGLNALRALTSLHDPQATELAVANLDSRDAQQRANALETLEAVMDPQFVRPLLAVWETPQQVGGDRGSPILELLRDHDPWIRACAAFAASPGEKDVVRVLRELAGSDVDPLVREIAAGKGEEVVETLSTLSVMERVLFLRKVRLFADLSPADLKHIAEIASEHLFPDGEVVAEQGEAGDEMHIVVSGEIRVVLGSGREVARRTSGEYVGEMAIISEEPRMASLVTAGEVRTLSMDRKRFERILKERPDTSLAVMRVLCDRLRESHAREPVEARV